MKKFNLPDGRRENVMSGMNAIIFSLIVGYIMSNPNNKIVSTIQKSYLIMVGMIIVAFVHFIFK